MSKFLRVLSLVIGSALTCTFGLQAAASVPCANQTPLGSTVRCNVDKKTCDLWIGGKWTPGELVLETRAYSCKEKTAIRSRIGPGISGPQPPQTMVPLSGISLMLPLSVSRVSATTISDSSDLFGSTKSETLTAKVVPVSGGSVILLVDHLGQRRMCLGSEGHCKSMMERMEN